MKDHFARLAIYATGSLIPALLFLAMCRSARVPWPVALCIAGLAFVGCFVVCCCCAVTRE